MDFPSLLGCRLLRPLGRELIDLDVFEWVQPPLLHLGAVDYLEGVELQLLRLELYCFLVRPLLQETHFELFHACLQPSVEVRGVVFDVQMSLVITQSVFEQGCQFSDGFLWSLEEEFGGCPQQADFDLVWNLLGTNCYQLGRILDKLPEIPNDLYYTAAGILLLGVFSKGVENVGEEGELFGVETQVGADEGDDVVADERQRSSLHILDHGLGDEPGIGLSSVGQQLGQGLDCLQTDELVEQVLSELVDNICEVVLVGAEPEQPYLGRLEVGRLLPADHELLVVRTEHIRL